MPLFVKVLPPEHAESDRAEARDEREKKTAADERLISLTADLVHYTAALFVATFVLAGITAGLVLVGYRQDRDAKESIAATKLAAESARKSAAAYVSTERAMLATSHFIATQSVDGATLQAVNFTFNIAWPNTGRTPAHAMIWTDHRVQWPSSPIPTFGQPQGHQPTKSVVGPSSAPSGPDQIIPISDVIEIANGNKNLFLYGRCQYSDIFDTSVIHITEVCVQVTFIGDVSALSIFPPREERGRFRYSAVGSQNGFVSNPVTTDAED